MAKILIYSDNRDLAAEMVGFAVASGHAASVLVFGAQEADALSDCGAEELLVVENIDVPEFCGKALAEYVKAQDFGLVLIGATARGRDLAAQVAAHLDCGMGSDVSGLSFSDGKIAYERTIYGGAIISEEEISAPAVVTCGRGIFESAAGKVTKRSSMDLATDARLKLVAREDIVIEGVDLGAADRVVGVGMGLSNEDELALAQELASALGGALGCSRGVAEERKWLPVENYVGISGRVITPQLYLTLGISGQVQHMYGARDSKIIVAVDKDEKAPMIKSADYYIIGDLAEYAPLITEAVRAR